MSKNTGTSELINYFDLGANGDVGIAGSLDINTIANATTDTDKFLVSDTGIIKYRTGAELLSDIGAAPATGGSYLPLAGGTLTGALNGTSSSFTGNIITSAGFFNFANNYGIQARNFQDTAYRTIFKLNTSNQVEIGRSTDISDIILGTASATNALTITSTGSATFSSSVGINGVYSPAAELQVGKSSDVTIAMSNFSSVTSGIRGGIAWYNSSVSTVANIRAVAVTDNVGTELQFYTRPAAGSLTQVMTISSSGKVGIGTGTPDNSYQGLTISGTDPSLRLKTTSGSGWVWTEYVTSAGVNNFSMGVNQTIPYFGIKAGAGLDNPNFAIVSSGNVLIGTTTDAGYKLDVSGTGRFSGRLLVNHSTASDYAAVFYNTSATGEGVTVRGGSTSSHNAFIVQPYNGATTLFSILATGAATFASSVTARSYGINNGGFRGGLYAYVDVIGSGSDNSPTIFAEGGANQGNIYFSPGGSATRQMTITSSGNVLIGTTTDNGDRMNISGAVSISSNLGVGRGSESGVRLSISGAGTSNAAYVIITRDSLGNDLFYVRNDGLVNTGTRAASPYNNTSAQIPNLYVSSGGTLERGTASSGRFKENIINWDGNGLDTILALKPKTFKYKKDYYNKADVDFLGLIAEDVAQVSPYLADYENEDRTGQVENVRYATIVVPLIKAIQELKAELDELKSKN